MLSSQHLSDSLSCPVACGCLHARRTHLHAASYYSCLSPTPATCLQGGQQLHLLQRLKASSHPVSQPEAQPHDMLENRRQAILQQWQLRKQGKRWIQDRSFSSSPSAPASLEGNAKQSTKLDLRHYHELEQQQQQKQDPSKYQLNHIKQHSQQAQQQPREKQHEQDPSKNQFNQPKERPQQAQQQPLEKQPVRAAAAAAAGAAARGAKRINDHFSQSAAGGRQTTELKGSGRSQKPSLVYSAPVRQHQTGHPLQNQQASQQPHRPTAASLNVHVSAVKDPPPTISTTRSSSTAQRLPTKSPPSASRPPPTITRPSRSKPQAPKATDSKQTEGNTVEERDPEGVHLLLFLAQKYRPQGMNEGRAQVSQVLPYSQTAWESASQSALRTGFLWHLPIQHLAYIAAAFAAASHPCSPEFVVDLLEVSAARLDVLVSWQQLKHQGGAAHELDQGRAQVRGGGLGVGHGGGKGMAWGSHTPMRHLLRARQGRGRHGMAGRLTEKGSSQSGMEGRYVPTQDAGVKGLGSRGEDVRGSRKRSGRLRSGGGGVDVKRRGPGQVEWFVDERHGLRRLRGTLKARAVYKLNSAGSRIGDGSSRSSSKGVRMGVQQGVRIPVGPFTLRSAGVLASAAARLCVASVSWGSQQGQEQQQHEGSGSRRSTAANEGTLHALPDLLQQLQMLLRAWLKAVLAARIYRPDKTKGNALWLAVLAWSISSLCLPETRPDPTHATKTERPQHSGKLSSRDSVTELEDVDELTDVDYDEDFDEDSDSLAHEVKPSREGRQAAVAEELYAQQIESANALAEQLAFEVTKRQGRLARLMDTLTALQLASAIEALGSAGLLDADDSSNTAAELTGEGFKNSWLAEDWSSSNSNSSATGSMTSGDIDSSTSSHPSLLLQPVPVRCSNIARSSDVRSSRTPLGSVERLAVRALVQQASRQAGRMNMPGLAAAYALLGGSAGQEIAAAAGVAKVAGASRRAHELEPLTERLARLVRARMHCFKPREQAAIMAALVGLAERRGMLPDGRELRLMIDELARWGTNKMTNASPSQALTLMYSLACLGWHNPGVWEKAASGALAHWCWDLMGRMSAIQVSALLAAYATVDHHSPALMTRTKRLTLLWQESSQLHSQPNHHFQSKAALPHSAPSQNQHTTQPSLQHAASTQQQQQQQQQAHQPTAQPATPVPLRVPSPTAQSTTQVSPHVAASMLLSVASLRHGDPRLYSSLACMALPHLAQRQPASPSPAVPLEASEQQVHLGHELRHQPQYQQQQHQYQQQQHQYQHQRRQGLQHSNIAGASAALALACSRVLGHRTPRLLLGAATALVATEMSNHTLVPSGTAPLPGAEASPLTHSKGSNALGHDRGTISNTVGTAASLLHLSDAALALVLSNHPLAAPATLLLLSHAHSISPQALSVLLAHANMPPATSLLLGFEGGEGDIWDAGTRELGSLWEGYCAPRHTHNALAVLLLLTAAAQLQGDANGGRRGQQKQGGPFGRVVQGLRGASLPSQANLEQAMGATQQQWLCMLGRNKDESNTAAVANEVSQLLVSMGARGTQTWTSRNAQRSSAAPPAQFNAQLPPQQLHSEQHPLQQSKQPHAAVALAGVMLPDVECILDSECPARYEQAGRDEPRQGTGAGAMQADAFQGRRSNIDARNGKALRVGVLLATEAMLLKGRKPVPKRKTRLNTQGIMIEGSRERSASIGTKAKAAPQSTGISSKDARKLQRSSSSPGPLQLTAEARLTQALLACQQGWDVIAVIGVEEWQGIGAQNSEVVGGTSALRRGLLLKRIFMCQQS